jgi:hypothetical protein
MAGGSITGTNAGTAHTRRGDRAARTYAIPTAEFAFQPAQHIAAPDFHF